MNPDVLDRIEIAINATAASMQEQIGELRRVNERLDEIAALLTPRLVDPNEPTLGELLAHLVAQGNEQLGLARKTIEVLGRLEQRLPAAARDGADAFLPSNGSRRT
jgi:hypothetical protein